MHPMLIVALIATAFVLLAWGLWALVRSWDRTNAILAAAPALPIRLVNVHDDVWVRGHIECARPVVVPHFGQRCVHYFYRLEEYVTKTRTTSDGKTETYHEWQTRETDQGHAPFRLNDAGHTLRIDPEQAQFQHEPSLSETLGRWRHSCNYTPYPGSVSAVGVVDEGKHDLIPYQHVPLIVTTKLRGKYLADAESSERWGARFGLAFLLIGFLGVGYALTRYLQTREGMQFKNDWWHPLAAVIAVLFGFFATALFWALRVYNSLTTFKVRADERWSSIDVQLKQRYDLLPNLVAVVKAYQQHEKDLFERLATIRSKALAGSRTDRVWIETETVAGMQQLFAVAEKYPNLKANENYLKLMDEMTALEEKIAHARTVFNDAVSEYNVQAQSFPANFIARFCRFAPYPLFSASLEEKQVPVVKTTDAAKR
jgi:LemA protein